MAGAHGLLCLLTDRVDKRLLDIAGVCIGKVWGGFPGVLACGPCQPVAPGSRSRSAVTSLPSEGTGCRSARGAVVCSSICYTHRCSLASDSLEGDFRGAKTMHGGSRVWGRAFQGPRPLSGLATALLSDLQQGPAPLDPSRAMVPNLFWYQEPESWKTIFPWTWVGGIDSGDRRWSSGCNASEAALLPRPPLTSCCAAQFLTGHGPEPGHGSVPVHGQGLGDP